jgi:hypothetical protein
MPVSALHRLGRHDRLVDMTDNLLGVPETRLSADPDVDAELTSGTPLVDVVTAHPSSSLAWALLADDAWGRGATLESYAYARVGYHRGLDALRKGGWRGQGPVPWSHEPNRGVLRSLYALRRAAEGIGELPEVDRLTSFLDDADPRAIPAIEQE